MKTPVCFALLALALIPLEAANTLRIYVIDVEGGGSTLVVSPSGESMLIDSGSAGDRDPQRISAAMRAAGLTKINYLFTTHYDGDHVGGAPAANKVAHFDRFSIMARSTASGNRTPVSSSATAIIWRLPGSTEPW
jgi:beta-lactamase superfamily II metal-dependent hydrolase